MCTRPRHHHRQAVTVTVTAWKAKVSARMLSRSLVRLVCGMCIIIISIISIIIIIIIIIIFIISLSFMFRPNTASQLSTDWQAAQFALGRLEISHWGQCFRASTLKTLAKTVLFPSSQNEPFRQTCAHNPTFTAFLRILCTRGPCHNPTVIMARALPAVLFGNVSSQKRG